MKLVGTLFSVLIGLSTNAQALTLVPDPKCAAIETTSINNVMSYDGQYYSRLAKDYSAGKWTLDVFDLNTCQIVSKIEQQKDKKADWVSLSKNGLVVYQPEKSDIIPYQRLVLTDVLKKTSVVVPNGSISNTGTYGALFIDDPYNPSGVAYTYRLYNTETSKKVFDVPFVGGDKVGIAFSPNDLYALISEEKTKYNDKQFSVINLSSGKAIYSAKYKESLRSFWHESAEQLLVDEPETQQHTLLSFKGGNVDKVPLIGLNSPVCQAAFSHSSNVFVTTSNSPKGGVDLTVWNTDGKIISQKYINTGYLGQFCTLFPLPMFVTKDNQYVLFVMDEQVGSKQKRYLYSVSLDQSMTMTTLLSDPGTVVYGDNGRIFIESSKQAEFYHLKN